MRALSGSTADRIGGIADLADRARWVERPTQVVGPGEALHEIAQRYPWVQRHLAFAPVEDGVELLGYSIRAFKVCHGRNGESHAYRFDRAGYAWAYCPDSIGLDEVQREPLRGLDLLVLGTAYYKEDLPAARRSLYDMTEAVVLLEDLRPDRTVFTHLSHGVDARRTYPLPAGVTVGHDGLDLPLG